MLCCDNIYGCVFNGVEVIDVVYFDFFVIMWSVNFIWEFFDGVYWVEFVYLDEDIYVEF